MSVTQETMQESLSDILSGKEIDDAPEPTPTGEKDTAPPAGEKEVAKVDDKPADKPVEKAAEKLGEKPAEKANDKPTESVKSRPDVAAIIDERRKRQALEAKIRELESAKPVAKPSVFENEDEAINSRVAEQTRSLKGTLYKQSVKLAQIQYGKEFEDAQQAFMEAAEADPRLYEGLSASDDPGEYIYSIGFQIKELAPVGGDLRKFRENARADLSAQLAERDTRLKALEAQVAELTQQKTDLEQLPRSLNKKPSSVPAAGDEDDEDIKTITRFGNKQR